MSEAVKKHPEADILVNFASLRSAYDSTMEALTYNQVWAYVWQLIESPYELIAFNVLKQK